MASISGNVKLDGSADYTDIVSGIYDLIASGQASGEIDEFYLYVLDQGPYSGSFNTFIPNSGAFYVIGDNTRFISTSTSNITGIYQQHSYFEFDNIIFDGNSSYNPIFNLISGKLVISDSIFINTISGITGQYSYLNFNDSSACGFDSGIFINAENITINNSQISKFETAIQYDSLVINNSTLHDNTNGIIGNLSGSLQTQSALIYNNTFGIKASGGYSNIIKSTFINDYPFYDSASGELYCYYSIMSGISYCVSGVLSTGIIQECMLYPTGWYSSNISSSGISYVLPQFYSPSVGNYNLIIDSMNGSSGIEYIDINMPEDLSLSIDNRQFLIYDGKGNTNLYEFIPFIYRQGNTIRFTDFNKETKFADIKEKRTDLQYSLMSTATITKHNIRVSPSFDIKHPYYGGKDQNPWDWDIKTFYSTKIDDEATYIIPRSFINLEETFGNEIDFLPEESVILYPKITKNYIKVYNTNEYRGVSYDEFLSRPAESLVWIIEGRNQKLIKQNAFTGENIEDFPLLCLNLSGRPTIIPSGLIKTGVKDDKFLFRRISDGLEVEGIGENGEFYWLATDINTKIDFRGLRTYKGHVFITGTRYSEDIYDRTVLSDSLGAGVIFMYDNNLNWYHYTANEDSSDGPVGMILESGNNYPTDLTIYEDSSIYIADYMNNTQLYKYKLAYDYAMVNTDYSRNTRVLLRESYQDITY